MPLDPKRHVYESAVRMDATAAVPEIGGYSYTLAVTMFCCFHHYFPCVSLLEA